MYKGVTVNYPIGDGGFNGSRNRQLIPVGQLSKARNIRFDTSSIVKAGGLSVFDSNAVACSPDILAGHDWHPTTALQRQVTVWSDGNIYKETSGNQDAVTLDSCRSFSEPIVFVEGGQESGSGNRKLFIYHANIMPQQLTADGATTSDLSNIPTDWDACGGNSQPAGAVYHDFRIYAFAPPTYPHTIYASNLDDHGDFSSGEPSPPIFQVTPGYGERISAAISDFHTGSRDLYVFKYPRGIFRIDTTSVVGAYIPVDTVSLDIGCPGPNAVAQVENDVWFIGQDAHIYSLSAVTSEQNVNRADLTALLNLEDWVADNVSRTEAKLKFARITYDPLRKEVHVAYRGLGDDLGSKVLVIDIQQPNNPRVTIDDRGEYFEAMWLARESTGNDRIYCGGTGGVFYKANDGTISVNGTSYTAEFELPETDFSWAEASLRARQKRFDWLELATIDAGDGVLNIEFLIDGVSYRTASIDLNAEGSLLGTGVMDSFILGGGLFNRTYKLRVGGFGNRLSIVFKSTDAKKFEIVAANISFKPLGYKGEH